MKLANRVALVTGAGSGIGKAAALSLAEHGAKLALLGRTEPKLQQTAREIAAIGAEAIVVRVDVGNAADMQRAIEQVAERWDRLDIVFANAGINGVWAPLEQIERHEWERTLATNLTGTFLTTKYALPLLKRQGGSVILCSSINGTRVFSNTGATAYACSKAGQVAFAKMAALELASHRIRVNVICPGAIETEIGQSTQKRNLEGLGVPAEFPDGWHPLRRAPGRPEDVARLVVFLASDDAIHITGSEMWIDGGESLIGIRG